MFRIISALLLLLGTSVSAQAQDFSAAENFTVGVREFENLAQKEGDQWTGFEVERFEKAAADAGMTNISYIEFSSVSTMLEALRGGEIDAALGGITVNAEREKEFDFTQTTLVTGYSMLVRGKEATSFDNQGLVAYNWGKVKSLPEFIVDVLRIMPTLFIVAVFFGLIYFVLDRWGKREDESEKPYNMVQAIDLGVHTTSTVGYGHRQPRTVPAILANVVLAALGIAIFANLIVSEIVADKIEQRAQLSIESPEELQMHQVGYKDGTSAADVVDYYKVPQSASHAHADYNAACLQVRDALGLDAVVGDDVPLRSWAARHGGGQVVVVGPFQPQCYGIVLPQGSAQRELLNQGLAWQEDFGEARRLRRAYELE